MGRVTYLRLPDELVTREVRVGRWGSARGYWWWPPHGPPVRVGDRSGHVVPGAVAYRTGPAEREGDTGDGRAVVPDAGNGAEGTVGTPARVQPDPHGDGHGDRLLAPAAPAARFRRCSPGSGASTVLLV